MLAGCDSGQKFKSTDITGVDYGKALDLTDHTGKPRHLQDFRGKAVVLFFGFTHCPDVCPTALFDISEILRELGGDGDRMRAMFVTVDPERDTPGKLKEYLSSFDPRLIAATGDEAAIKAIEKAYRVYAKRVPLDSGGYTMDHTAIVYLMDKQGRFVAPFNMKRRPAEAAAELRRYM
jgi:protein SCO1